MEISTYVNLHLLKVPRDAAVAVSVSRGVAVRYTEDAVFLRLGSRT